MRSRTRVRREMIEKKKKISRSHEISSRHVYAFIVPVHCSGIPPRFSSPTVYRFPGVLFPAGGGGSKETPFVYLPRRNLSKLPPPPPPLIPLLLSALSPLFSFAFLLLLLLLVPQQQLLPLTCSNRRFGYIFPECVVSGRG